LSLVLSCDIIILKHFNESFIAHLETFLLQLFKMDIEGFEADAIEGSMQVHF